MTKEIATTTQVLLPSTSSIFFDVHRFEHAQRVAKVLSSSTMVPDHFKNNIGNCLIALNYADRIGADVFMVMQSLYVVHGRPGIEAKLAIAMLNASGRFSPLKFRYNKDKTECEAYAKDLQSGEEIFGPMVSISMANAEGWTTKTGSKWKTMPVIMLGYRAASFFIKQNAPEVFLGMQTKDEIDDIVSIEKGPDNVYKKINDNANTGEIIDIESTPNDGHFVPTQEEEAEIIATEMKEATKERPF